MADVDNSTPTPTPAPDPTATAPAVSGTPSGAPLDLGGLVQPGAQPTLAAAKDSSGSSINDYVGNANAAYQKAAEAAGKSTAPPPAGPHAGLLAMVQGLALGFDAFGKSIATHGREGGVEEVQQVQAAQQAQKIQAQQARDQAKNAQVQQQMMVGDTNMRMAQNIHFLATMPDEIEASHVKLAGEKQAQAITGADFQAAHGGMTPDEFSSALSGKSSSTSGGAPNTFFTTNAQQQLGAATKILGSEDPYVKQLQATLADPKATPKDLWTATNRIQNQVALQEKATDAQVKKDTAAANSTVGKLSTPQALADPGAQAAIQAKIDDPNTDPADLPRLRTLMPQAAVAQLNAQTIKEREKRNEQIVTQGDPDVAGKLLANRSLTLSELKSRQVTPEFIASVVKAAQKYDPNFKPAEADAQAKIAGAPANAQFFGNTDSLLVKGGTLDQLQAAHAALGNTSLPFANKLENWRKASLGQGPQAAFAAAALGVADDASKVMSGGQGSDASRQQALDIIGRDLSNEGLNASVAQLRSQVTSQRNGRISTNPYMRDMYPDPSTRQETAGVAGTQPLAVVPANSAGIAPGSDGKFYYHDKSGNILGLAPAPSPTGK